MDESPYNGQEGKRRLDVVGYMQMETMNMN